jgi:glycine/serine hydroxymethyltransferase
MGDAEMTRIGNWIATILSDIDNTSLQARIRAEIVDFTRPFPIP